ncbi:transposase [Escherichia coli M605]|uniref:Transposase n=1 Tax=Escherichia coli M605 TaxID=656417 RepID=F4SY17_ECOLX|nr:transposase [Escherichia coli M605]
MSEEVQVAVGIDVSRDTLDIRLDSVVFDCSVSNDDAGFSALRNQLSQYAVSLILLEATGGYEKSCCLLSAILRLRCLRD